MACQKVCKQVRSDIKVTVVYKAQSLHLLYYTLHSCVKKKVTMDKALYTTFTSISFPTCLHTFWHSIPILLYKCFYILMMYFSYIVLNYTSVIKLVCQQEAPHCKTKYTLHQLHAKLFNCQTYLALLQ